MDWGAPRGPPRPPIAAIPLIPAIRYPPVPPIREENLKVDLIPIIKYT